MQNYESKRKLKRTETGHELTARLINGTSLVAQTVKRLPAMWETWVRSLGWEDPWRRKWQPTPVSLPGESHGQRSLVGYSPQGPKESDTTEVTWQQQRRKWQPTPVLLPGKSHGQRSLVGYSPQGCKELHTTERQHGTM